jgi:hypothetical protein
MHTDVLTAEARGLFPKLSAFTGQFYLAGGTGLALQLGHRVSVDFDLFSSSPIKKTLLVAVENTFTGLGREVLVSNKNELTLVIGNVKFTYLHYPFPVLLPFVTDGPIPCMAAQEILAAKAYTIGRRGEFKDYLDLYCGLLGRSSTLVEIIELAKKKYAGAFNDRLFLEQLVYLDDIEAVDITMIGSSMPNKQELKQFFSALIKQSGIV